MNIPSVFNLTFFFFFVKFFIIPPPYWQSVTFAPSFFLVTPKGAQRAESPLLSCAPLWFSFSSSALPKTKWDNARRILRSRTKGKASGPLAPLGPSGVRYCVPKGETTQDAAIYAQRALAVKGGPKGSLYITSLSVPKGEHSKTCFASVVGFAEPKGSASLSPRRGESQRALAVFGPLRGNI